MILSQWLTLICNFSKLGLEGEKGRKNHDSRHRCPPRSSFTIRVLRQSKCALFFYSSIRKWTFLAKLERIKLRLHRRSGRPTFSRQKRQRTFEQNWSWWFRIPGHFSTSLVSNGIRIQSWYYFGVCWIWRCIGMSWGSNEGYPGGVWSFDKWVSLTFLRFKK